MISILISEARKNGLTSIRGSFPYQGMESIVTTYGTPIYREACRNFRRIVVLPLGFGEYEIIWNPDDYPG